VRVRSEELRNDRFRGLASLLRRRNIDLFNEGLVEHLHRLQLHARLRTKVNQSLHSLRASLPYTSVAEKGIGSDPDNILKTWRVVGPANVLPSVATQGKGITGWCDSTARLASPRRAISCCGPDQCSIPREAYRNGRSSAS
jgi:hypothetical protein